MLWGVFVGYTPFYIMKYIVQILHNDEEVDIQVINTQEDFKDIEGLITHTLDDLSDRNVKTIVTKVNEEDENRI